MKELSLFSGSGGGLLATKYLLGWETVGYVEIEEYCQKVLKARIADGYLDAAPIFGDIRKFISEGYAKAYQGMVDVVTGGFPCQPFSVAGKQQGADDERNMWPATLQVISIVKPRFAFLENVPGLVSSGYFGVILANLAEIGYDARWGCLGANEVGAPHKRERLWILAHAQLRSGAVLNNSLARKKRTVSAKKEQIQSRAQIRNRTWWLSEPNVGRVAHGVANGLDRTKALGNGQVPAVAATAWRLLSEREK